MLSFRRNFQNVSEQIQLVFQILKVLALFEENQFKNIIISDEFVSYDELNKKFVVVDQHREFSLPEFVWSKIQHKKPIYLSPTTFESLFTPQPSTDASVFFRDNVVSTGMLLLSIMIDEHIYSKLYDVPGK